MKRKILLSLITLLCLPVAVYAASIGGVGTQGQGKWSVGLDQEFVFDRDIGHKSGSFIAIGLPATTSWKEGEIDKMSRTMVKASYGLLDNLDIYLKLGVINIEMKAKMLEAGTEKIFTAKIDNAFALGVGLKASYEFNEDWLLGIDLQHHLRLKYDARCTYPNLPDWDVDYFFYEWHIAPYIAKRIGNLVPYFGVKYSDLRVKLERDADNVMLEADDKFGIFLGTDYKVDDVWSLNLEARFIDETAISFAGTHKF